MAARPRFCAPARRVAVLLAVLALGACGGDEDRDAAGQYLKQANKIQHDAAPAFRRANRTYVRFSKRQLKDDKAAPALESAEDSIRSTRKRLARLKPPVDARALHASLLELYDANADFAHESTLLAEYLPAASEALKPLRGANRALRSGLKGASGKPKRQVAVLRRYGQRLSAILTAIRELDPPPILTDAHRAQASQLDRTRKLVANLGDALEAQQAKRVARLLARFRALQQEGGGPALTRDAVRAYNSRYRQLTKLASRVQAERAGLEKKLS